MKLARFTLRIVGMALWMTLASSLLTGCKTTPAIDWSKRVGNYTYDQVVAELGSPTRSAKLSDNGTLAEWVTRHALASSSVSVGGGTFGSHSTTEPRQHPPISQRDAVLIMVFDADGKLKSWSKNY